uniref:Leucine repeat adapter protein 25 n=1 Tax=Strigamia maritima TaxID=126957 RepID=T1JC23_STRMM
MASLQGLPPLPKSLSGLLTFSSAQWKEMERLHTMRTMIQQDLSRAHNSSDGDGELDSVGKKKVSLDAQLALLRKEMVGLRQLDMSLLCQLWSLNESIQEYKHLMQERLAWDNGLDLNWSCDEADVNTPLPRYTDRTTPNRDLNSVPENLSLSSSTSQSSLEFGDI